ncbi:MAG: hypothetical protein OXE92_03780 [Bacteroidetes bacterium]|nr:hypothetical protein [Bacteroidota bacterium]MCY4204828.1 hypothetical protein [Bacteroidota bacterium]
MKHAQLLPNLCYRVKKSVEVFNDAVLALKDVTAMLLETDSAAIHEKLEMIRKENKHIEDGQESIRKSIDATADRIVTSLKPRTFWEGVFGRRKD